MTHTLILTPRDRRSAAFFWLGVGVFPVFWSWFTLGKQFARWQKIMAFSWMLALVAIFLGTFPVMENRYAMLANGYPVLFLLLGVGLWFWLVARLTDCGCLLAMLFVCLTSNIASGVHMGIELFSMGTFAWTAIFFPLVPALLHLTAEPVRKELGCCNKSTASKQKSRPSRGGS